MEVSQPHRRIPVTEPSQPSAARFAAHGAAEAAGFSETDVYRAGLVATELATNLVKHAAHGEVLVRIVSRAPRAEIEILAIDRGPGITDLSRSLSDGHSTAGTPGTGLGAAKRFSEDFDIHSERNRGTVVMARLRAGRAPRAPSRLLEFSGLALAKPGETICGDAWQIHHHADGALALMADGLGHGVQAGEASGAAIAAVETQSKKNLSELLETMHAGLRHTRGAAAAIAEIRPGPRLVKFAGIGNISATIRQSLMRGAPERRSNRDAPGDHRGHRRRGLRTVRESTGAAARVSPCSKAQPEPRLSIWWIAKSPTCSSWTSTCRTSAASRSRGGCAQPKTDPQRFRFCRSPIPPLQLPIACAASIRARTST